MANVIEFTIRGKDAFSGVLNKTGRAIGRVTGTVAKAVGGISAITAAISPVLILNTARNFEKMEASLKTVTGSANNAAAAMGLIQNFASTTPFQVTEITDAFIKLKALGLDPSEDSLRSFGNTAAALQKPLNQVIEAVADAGTFQFERLREAFNITTKTLEDTVEFTFQGVTTSVEKNAESITKFLQGIGETEFAGAMSDQMNTLDGRISNLKDNVDKLFVTLGKAGALDIAKKAVSSLSEFVSNLGPILIRTAATALVAFQNIKNAIQQSIAGGTVWEDFIRLAFSAVQKVFDIFVSNFQALLPVIGGIFKVLWESFLILGKWAFDRVKQVYIDGFPEIIAAVGGMFVLLWKGAVEGAKFAWSNIKAVFTGDDFISFDTLFENIDKATKETRKNIDDLLLSIDVESPPLVDIIANGIPEATAEARAKLAEDFSTMVGTMGDNLIGLKNSIVETFGISRDEVDALVANMVANIEVTTEQLKENNKEAVAQVSEFWQQLDKRVTEFNKRQGTFAKQMANHVFSITQNVIKGISDAAARSIIMGEKFSDAMKNILNNVGVEIISMLIRVGIQRALTALLFTQAAKVEQSSQAASGISLAGINAFASTAAIPVIGPALAPAAAASAIAYTSGIAATGAAATSAAASGLGQFHDGGVVPNDGTFTLQRGEVVIPNNPNGDIIDAINSNFGGNQGPSTIVIDKISLLENATSFDALMQMTGEEAKQLVQDKLLDPIGDLADQGILSRREERGI